MSERKWYSGPPPHVGWWLCTDNSFEHDYADMWRWWDGEAWSFFSLSTDSAHNAGKNARCRAYFMRNKEKWGIRWSDYYPANARVPRVKP